MNKCRDAHRLDIRAEQQVLAIVERQAVAKDAARATAERRRRIVQLDAPAVPRELDRGRASGPAASDDDDHARHAARVAIHSLRSGVSAMRRSSTW
jgi:hypothetical protein